MDILKKNNESTEYNMYFLNCKGCGCDNESRCSDTVCSCDISWDCTDSESCHCDD